MGVYRALLYINRFGELGVAELSQGNCTCPHRLYSPSSFIPFLLVFFFSLTLLYLFSSTGLVYLIHSRNTEVKTRAYPSIFFSLFHPSSICFSRYFAAFSSESYQPLLFLYFCLSFSFHISTLQSIHQVTFKPFAFQSLLQS